MSYRPTEAWEVQDVDFPASGTVQAQLGFAVRYAALAPSSHNSQPWSFQLLPDRLDLLLDRTRALPVVDPSDRELTISCGAALFNLRVALRYFGYEPEIEHFPDGDNLDLAASVRLGATRKHDPSTLPLFKAITQRHTHRRTFDDRAVPPTLVHALRAAASSEGAWLHPVEGPHRDALAALIMEADRIQSDDPRFREELATWMRDNRTERDDGMPGFALGLTNLEARLAPFLVRTFDRGDGVAARDQRLSLGSPLLAVLGTPQDEPLPWLRAGEALEHVLLLAQSEGVTASFLNQPVEVPALRERLASELGVVGKPQLVLRLGYATPSLRTPRRPLGEVLLSAGPH